MHKNSSVQQRAFRNSSVGIISFLLSLVQTIILVPVLLKYWGNEKYGVWLALYAGFSLLQSLDTGHINYIGNKLNITYNTDRGELKSTLASSFYMAFIVGIAQILLVLLLILFNYLPAFTGIDSTTIIKYKVDYSLISLIVFWFLSGSFGGILHKLMVPSGFYYKAQWWGILYRFCQFISIVVVAIAGGTILSASIIYGLIQLIVYGLTFFYIKNNISDFYPWWQGGKLEIAFQNFRNSLVLTFNSFIQQLNNNGLVLLISNLFASFMLPVFTTIRTMTNTGLSITNLFISSILPDFVRYHTSKEKVKLNSVFTANWFFSGLIVNMSILLVIPFAKVIFTIWTKGLILFDSKLFISLAASISLINFGAGLYSYLYAINSLRSISVITISRVIVLFSFSYYLSGLMGLAGIGVAVLISEIFSSLIFPYFYVQKILKSFDGRLDKRASISAIGSSLIIIVLFVFELTGTGFSYYIWSIALTLATLNYIYNWIFMEKEVKDRFMNLVRNVF